MKDLDENKPLLQTCSDQTYNSLKNQGSDEESPFTGTVKGLSVGTCAMFIIAEMAGSGILALPKAVSEAGWTGVGLLIFCCILSLYCGIVLGKCWTFVRENNKEYHGHVRDPYPLIGLAAGGRVGKLVVEFCVLVTLFGVCIVFLLLASQQISDLLDTNIGSFTPKTEFRIWILICGGCLLPFTWLATPKDLWPFALAASGCTIFASIFMIVRTSMELYKHGIAPDCEIVPTTGKSFFDAFGTIAFAFGGAALLPTFQTDMKEPRKFPYAALIAFLGVLCMYIPVTVLPFLAFGTNIDDNILVTLGKTPGNGKTFVTISNALITFHLLFSFVITINPIGQQIEEYLKMDHKFGYKRILLRTILVFIVIGIAELIPNFGPILSLIGGSTVTMMAFILPALFYLKLFSGVPLYIKVFHVEIIIIALICGGTAIYSAASRFTNPFKV